MSAAHYRLRFFLPLAFVRRGLLLATLFLATVPLCHAAGLTVSFSVAPIPERTYTEAGAGGGTSTASAALARRSGTVTLTPGVATIAQTTGSIHTGVSYDGEDSVSASDTFTRTFSVNGVGHPQTQAATIFGDGDEDSGDFFSELTLLQSSTVTYDLGTQGKVDVTALAAHSDTDFDPEPPLQYRFLLHDVPGYPNVKSVLVGPGTVYGGATTYGKVSLTAPAPAGGTAVALTLLTSPEMVGGAVSIPDSVTVPAGRTFITFPIPTVKESNSGPYGDKAISFYATTGGKGGTASFDILYRYFIDGHIASNGHSLNFNNVTVSATATGTFTLTSTATPAAAIPDNNAAGITSTLVPAGTGTISSLVVGINITHPRIKDLIITLQAPDGTLVYLHNKTGGTQQNLQTSYPVLNAPVDSLSAFTGKPVQGTWKLSVKDAVGGTVGTLNAWSLTFTYDGTVSATTPLPSYSEYNVGGLKEGTYTVTPSSPDTTFSPVSRTVTVGPAALPPNVFDVDFDAGPAVFQVVFSNDDPIGGTSITGTVNITKPAPAAGLKVTLSSSDSSLASVPSSVTVPKGKRTATFTITTFPVTDPNGKPVKIFATGGSATTYDFLFIDPAMP